MPFFSGQSSGRRVDLRGKSRAEETREQVLERTRREREARRVDRLQQDSAKKIQASWRGRKAVGVHRAAVRAAWLLRFGEGGCRAGLSDLDDDTFLRNLLFWQHGDTASGQALAKACQLLLQQHHPPGGADPQSHQDLKLHRCKQLLAACLRTLTACRNMPEWSRQLRSAAASAAAVIVSLDPLSQPVPILAAALMHFTGADALPASNDASFQQPSRVMATQLMLHLARSGLLQHLSRLTAGSRASADSKEHPLHHVEQPSSQQAQAGSAAMDVDPESASGSISAAHAGASTMGSEDTGSKAGSGGKRRKSDSGAGNLHAETGPASLGQRDLRTRLVHGLLTAYLDASGRQNAEQRQACVYEMLHILCQPFLWRREPACQGLQAAMCTLAVQALAGVTHAELAGLLPTGHVWGRAGAAICLLSNLLEAGGPTLMCFPSAMGSGSPDKFGAKQLSPIGHLIDPTGNLEIQQTVIVENVLVSPHHPAVTELAWDADRPEHQAVQEFYSAADRALPATLKPLVMALLPFTIAFDPAHAERPQHLDSGQGPMSPPDVWALCQFILALVQVPGLRQKTLITLAVSADFVPRLWASFLKETPPIKILGGELGSRLDASPTAAERGLHNPHGHVGPAGDV
ncbi:hypothetical protein WJX84_004362 [Apatococcus fuscideae]|uniref:HECT-type E3 ubiquitin transferase n=1 Tax=Apatococcus fuscideae TaxID=2026836 RepID=A0AAW1SXH2_9CHLO